MNKPTSLIFGEVLFDCFDGEPPVIGGAPLNVAWHLKGFNEDAHLISAVGNDDLGKNVLDKLENWTLAASNVAILPHLETGKVVVDASGPEAEYKFQEYCAFDEIPIDNVAPLCDGSEGDDQNVLIYHGSLALRHEKSSNNLMALRKRYDRKIIMDVNLRAPWWNISQVQELLVGTYVAKLSVGEFSALSDIAVDESQPISHIESLLHEFKERYQIFNLVITAGEQGALLIDGHNEAVYSEAIPPSHDIVDTVGAGDAFMSVVILGQINQWDWKTTLSRAQEFASYILTQRGATISDPGIYGDFKALWSLS